MLTLGWPLQLFCASCHLLIVLSDPEHWGSRFRILKPFCQPTIFIGLRSQATAVQMVLSRVALCVSTFLRPKIIVDVDANGRGQIDRSTLTVDLPPT